MFRLTVRIDPDLAYRAKVLAARERTTLQELVSEALAARLNRPVKARAERLEQEVAR
jgi:predicted HicB family RNase H-like nuclease